LGGALAPLLLVRLFAAMGDWKMPLVLVAVLGLAWCAWFWPWFRNLPEEMSQVNREERKLIEAGRAQRAGARHGDVPWTRMLKSRSVWALCLMYGFLGFSGNFYLTLLPTYLRNHRHLSSEVTGWLTSLPFAFGVVACFVGGSFSDGIIRRWGKRWGRRIVGATGLTVAGLAILAVPWVENVVALGFLLTLAFFGNDLAMAPAWAAAADIGEHHTGTVAGTMNMMASFMAAVQAIVIGRLLGSHNLVMPFVLLAVSYALGTLAWIGVDARQTLAEQR
jgi:MFS transporter, ACS family, glucarate transporter